jgi:hypothetical protein
MKAIAIGLAISICLSVAANAQTRDPPAAAPAPAAAKKKPDTAKDGYFCRWKGGDFSPGAEFCVFSGRAMLCENGVWKREDLAACIVTPAVLP